MATIKTHDLIKCNNLYPTLPSVNNSGIYPYNGLFVEFDDDIKKSYKVRKNVQGRFVHPSIASFPSEGRPAGTDSKHTITSMKFNGVEVITAAPQLFLTYNDLVYTSYPLYTLGNEYSYTSNVANGVIVGDSTIDLGNNYNNFYRFVENTINSHTLNVKISRSPALWWAIDGFGRIDNIILEKYYDDDFEFTVVAILYDGATGEELISTEFRYVFNGETVAYYQNGILLPNTAPYYYNAQFSDENSFFSYDYFYDTIEEIISCPVLPGFGASLSTEDNCSSVSISCDCKVITFSDTSNYDSNGMPGHSGELFTSRKIIMTRPDGTTYIWGTSDIVGADQIIQPHYNSSNTFQYTLTSVDSDGIYEFQLCTYPDWTAGVLYDSFLQTIVNRNGTFYKVISSNSNLDPSLSANSNYWSEYSCTDNCNTTRYCTNERIVILCISLLKCYKKLVLSAFCSTEKNPCKSLCENKDFINAMKFKVTMDALEFSVCSNDWISASKQVDILNKICCCNG
jgi:hypothetical protein